MAEDRETFLARWSRLKQEQDKKLPEKKGEAPAGDTPAPALPEVDQLNSESDFTAFMHPKVGDALRRAALKKLFSDPHFNLPDPYEAYSGDWTGGEPISEEVLATLNQARTLLFDQPEKKEQTKPDTLEQSPAQAAASGVAVGEDKAKNDEPGRQDA